MTEINEIDNMTEIKNIIIDVKIFATLRNFVIPKPEIGVAVKYNMKLGSTILDLIKMIGLPEEEVVIIFINHRHADKSSIIPQNARVGLFPPVGGG